MISSPTLADIVTPDAMERELAEASRIAVAEAAGLDQSGRLTFVAPAQKTVAVTLPPAAVRVLSQVLNEMAQGHAITVLPVEDEITTQEAADILHVSRPHFIALLEKGELAYRKVGNQRRVRLREVLAYKEKQYEQSTRTMNELAKLSDELGLYD